MTDEEGPRIEAVFKKCECRRCNTGLAHVPTLDELRVLQAQVWGLEAGIAAHDTARAELFHQQETLHAAEWRAATEQIESLRAELDRVTALSAQWAQEREDAREQLGREMATVDDQLRYIDRLEAALARVTQLHRRDDAHDVVLDYCVECEHRWPCPTIPALAGGTSPEPTEPACTNGPACMITSHIDCRRPVDVASEPPNPETCVSCAGAGRYGRWAICPDCLGQSSHVGERRTPAVSCECVDERSFQHDPQCPMRLHS